MNNSQTVNANANVNTFRLFSKKLPTMSLHNPQNTKQKEVPLEQQQKELLYWESQYEKMFEYIEKKRQDRINRRKMYTNLFSINLKNQNNKQSFTENSINTIYNLVI